MMVGGMGCCSWCVVTEVMSQLPVCGMHGRMKPPTTEDDGRVRILEPGVGHDMMLIGKMLVAALTSLFSSPQL